MPPSPHKSRPTRETGPKKRAPRTPKNSKTPNSPRVSKATKATVAAANGDPPAGAGDTTTATNSGPSNVTKYVEGVSREAESLRQRLTSLCNSTNIPKSCDPAVWAKLASAVRGVSESCAAVTAISVPATVTPPPLYHSPTPPMNTPPRWTAVNDLPASSTIHTGPQPAGADAEEAEDSTKEFKTAATYTDGDRGAPLKRRHAVAAGAENEEQGRPELQCEPAVKRAKGHHGAASGRTQVVGKRGRDEDYLPESREDMKPKRPRPGYFQAGDPPMEYEDFSDDEKQDEQNVAEQKDAETKNVDTGDYCVL